MSFKVALLCMCLVLANARPDATRYEKEVHKNEVLQNFRRLFEMFQDSASTADVVATTDSGSGSTTKRAETAEPTAAPTDAPSTAAPVTAETEAPTAEASTAAPVVTVKTEAPTTEAPATTEAPTTTVAPIAPTTAKPNPKPCRISNFAKDVSAILNVVRTYVSDITSDILEMESEVVSCISPLSKESIRTKNIFHCNIPAIIKHFIEIPMIHIRFVTSLLADILKLESDIRSCF